jgi:hypothetical protein
LKRRPSGDVDFDVVLVSLAAILATNMFSAFGAQRGDGVRIGDKNGLTAVDHGDTVLCTASLSPAPTVAYHLAISDPKLMRFAATGACLYVTDQVGAIKGDILVVSGSGGTTAVRALTDATGYTSE